MFERSSLWRLPTMGLLDKIRGEFVDIIEWLDHTRDTLVWRFPRYRNQIKNGAQLIVRPGQLAVFVSQGKLADVFGPGQHRLETKNLPVLSTLKGWPHLFDSPFKSEVYYVNTRIVTHLKWGTPAPVMITDPEFGRIRVKAFGTYTLRATDPKALLTELVGTDQSFESDEIHELIRSMINASFAEVIADSNISAFELAANYSKISEKVRRHAFAKVNDDYGLDIPQLFIVNVSLPEAVDVAIDAQSGGAIIGDMGRFSQYQMGRAVTMAASNPSGGAASGMGLGMGVAMMGQPGILGGAPVNATNIPPALGASHVGSVFHVAVAGKQEGPYSGHDLALKIAAGDLDAKTLVWSPGMATWVPAANVPQLALHFAPPPLPSSDA